MKNLFSIILTALLLSTASITQANDSLNGADRNPVTTLKKQIDRIMNYPVFQEMQGTVEVKFTIDENGEVKILNVDASNQQLIDYVVKKLKKIKLEKGDDNIGQTIKYRFVFKKQA